MAEHSKHKRTDLFLPIIGGICGLVYVVLDEETLPAVTGIHSPRSLALLHNFLDFILPVLFGIFVGIGIGVLRKQSRLNKQLSFRNSQLQQNLLVNTLISHFLHEIRNPMHNLSAVLEDGLKGMSEDQVQVVQRALFRFDEIASRYKNWESTVDNIDPREPVVLKPWLENFIRDNLDRDLKGLGIVCEQHVEPLLVRFHSVLLEQAFISVVANAFEALEEKSERRLKIFAHLKAPSGERNVELKILNSGGIFPEEVLKTQARTPVSSRQGTGFGLLLTRRVVEQAKGDLRLENTDGMACVTLVLSGEKI